MSDITLRRLIEQVAAQKEIYQIKLPVPVDDLSPVFSAESIKIHYGTLYKNYVKKARDGEGEFQVAGAKLHTLFFEQLQESKSSNPPTGAIESLIDQKFGSFSEFKDQIKDAALSIQGAGWVYVDTKGNIKTIANHKVVDNVAIIIDMWEHSYIIDYGADKEKYLKNIWKIINWSTVNTRLNHNV